MRRLDDLSVSYHKIVQAHEKKRDIKEARSYSVRMLSIDQKLSDRQPRSTTAPNVGR